MCNMHSLSDHTSNPSFFWWVFCTVRRELQQAFGSPLRIQSSFTIINSHTLFLCVKEAVFYSLLSESDYSTHSLFSESQYSHFVSLLGFVWFCLREAKSKSETLWQCLVCVNAFSVIICLRVKNLQKMEKGIVHLSGNCCLPSRNLHIWKKANASYLENYVLLQATSLSLSLSLSGVCVISFLIFDFFFREAFFLCVCVCEREISFLIFFPF